MQRNFLFALCLSLVASISQAQNVFNTGSPQPMNNVNESGGPMTTVQSPDYYNNLIATQNHQAYQAIVNANKANQNDPSLTALQQQLINSANNQPSTTNNQASGTSNQTSLPSNPAPVNPAPQIVVPPQPNIMYQTPVTNTTTNNTATNFGGGSNTSSSGSNSNSSNSDSAGNLTIQY